MSILLSGKLPWHCQAVVKDPDGLFVFLKGLVGEVQLTLATLYVPNDHQGRFLKHTLDKLLEFREGQLILGGDFNVPLIPSSDPSTGTSSVPPAHRKALHTAQLIDVWRLQHSGERVYTFYSSPHKLYTRIDFFMIPHDQLHLVSNTTIGQITWSDHVPISLTYTLSESPSPRSLSWRLNESLLQIPEVLTDVTKKITLYFQENDTQD